MPMVTMKKLAALRLLAKGLLLSVKKLSSNCEIYSGKCHLRRPCRGLRCDTVLNAPATSMLSMLSKKARRLYLGEREALSIDVPAGTLLPSL